MKPNDLYRLPVQRVQDWHDASSLCEMFEIDGFDYSSTGRGTSFPLRIETKLLVPDEEANGGEAVWQTFAWKGRPFGIVMQSSEKSVRVVTDRDLFRQAYLALSELRMPGVEGAWAATDDLDDLDDLGGHTVVRTQDGMRAIPRRFVANGRMVVDPVTLRGALNEGPDCLASLDLLGRHEVTHAVLTAIPEGWRVLTGFDEAKLTNAVPSYASHWPCVLVADSEGTHVIGIEWKRRHALAFSTLRVTSLGGPDLFNALALGQPEERVPDDYDPPGFGNGM